MQRFTLALLSAVALTLTTAVAQGALTTESCLAAKVKAAGKFRKCRDGEQAKLLQAKPADVAKCTTKFQDKIAKLTQEASDAAIECRYGDNGDGTVTDYDTQLQWEKKDSADSMADFANPHDVDNTYTWNHAELSDPDGTVFMYFLRQLTDCVSSDGATLTGGFAGYCDWRLPTIVELQTIFDPNQGKCGGGSGACIDPIVGPTAEGPTASYWSSTTFQLYDAWRVSFGGPGFSFGHQSKDNFLFARAVRGGL
jgi:hypothetical protein